MTVGGMCATLLSIHKSIHKSIKYNPCLLRCCMHVMRVAVFCWYNMCLHFRRDDEAVQAAISRAF